MNNSTDIKSALSSYAVALDHAAKQRDPLDPMTLQQRKVDEDMNDLLHEQATQPTLEAEPNRRKFGTAIRVGAGALIGALVTGGVFLASGNGGSPTGQVVTEAPAALYLLKFSSSIRVVSPIRQHRKRLPRGGVLEPKPRHHSSTR